MLIHKNMKYLNIFLSWITPASVPNYYFDNSLSDEEKLREDWNMIGNDWNKVISKNEN